jgi:hypothetical protein
VARAEPRRRGIREWMVDVDKLLMGAIDLHVHAGPSAVARELDAAEMMLEAAKVGYRAFVVKDHFFPTMLSAAIVQKHLAEHVGAPSSNAPLVFGGIALNRSVGGFNIKAVDVANAMGAKIVWMPTVSAENHIRTHKNGLRFPAAHGLRVKERPIICDDGAGTLKKQAAEVLEFIADTAMIIATGHGCVREIDAIVRTAVSYGAKRIVVNHPQYMIGASLEDIARWASLGAYIELNACVYVPQSHFKTVPLEDACVVIETVGPDKVVLVSDYGQKGNGSPVAGLREFVDLLHRQQGISWGSMRKMLSDNPATLLGLTV